MPLSVRYVGADLIIQGLATPPFGPGFAPAVLVDADAREVRGSTWANRANMVEWRVLRAGMPVATVQVDRWRPAT
jgi:hypothetical protein